MAHPNPDFFYQPGAGPLYDIGPYYMSALLALLGPVSRVCAMANRAQDVRTIPVGPNLFGGDTLYRTQETYRWQDSARSPQYVDVPWQVAPNNHPFNAVSHAENARGIGLVDMVYAIRDGRAARASGDMALHSLEGMDGMMISAHEHRFYEPETTFARPAPLPLNFPASEG